MKKLLLAASLFALASAQETPFPKASKAYQAMVEAAAKLLEFDIIREDLNRKQAAVLTDIHQLQLTTGGSSVRALQYLEGMVQGYDEVIPVFLELQDQLKADASNPDQAGALHGLIKLLETPEILHMVMPEPKYVNAYYRSAMEYAPLVELIKGIKKIVLRNATCSCQEDFLLNESLRLFYSIVSQALVNIFEVPMHHKDSKISKDFNDCAILFYDLNKLTVSDYLAEDGSEVAHVTASKIGQQRDANLVKIVNSGFPTSGDVYGNSNCDITNDINIFLKNFSPQYKKWRTDNPNKSFNYHEVESYEPALDLPKEKLADTSDQVDDHMPGRCRECNEAECGLAVKCLPINGDKTRRLYKHFVLNN